MARYQDEAEAYMARTYNSIINRRKFLTWCAAFGTGVVTTQLTSCNSPSATNTGAGSPTSSTSSSPIASGAVTGKGAVLPVTIPMAELVAKAKAEGKLRAYAMPPDWANWEGCFNLMESKYGVKATYKPEGALSSGEAIQKYLAEANNPVGDIADVGIVFGSEAKTKGAIAAYKNSRWADIPDNLKDTEGFWASPYGGVLSFGVNPEKAKSVPKTWKELVSGSYPNMVAINGDPRQSNSALLAVISAAYANGGSIDQIEKGIQLFADLKKAGNFTPAKADTAGLLSGEVGIAIKPDFLNLTDKDKFAGKPVIEVVIPSDGAVGTNYVQAINRLAPNPYAARLFQEFLYSDEGQLEMLKGYVRPTLISKLTIPAALQAKLPSPDQYKNVVPSITDQSKLDAAKKIVQEKWGPMVLGQ